MSSHTASRATFRELAEATAEAGVSAIALTSREYKQFLAGGECEEDMVAVTGQTGVRVTDLESVFGVLEPDPTGRTARFADHLFALADLFGAQSIGVHSGFDGDVDAAAERLATLCDRATVHGLAVGVEPVSVMGLHDLAAAWAVIERCERRNVGLVLDTWHFFRGAGTIDMIHTIPASAFRTVQISDGLMVGPSGLDYLEDTLTNRVPPGEGEFDLCGIIRALDEIGADVAWDMEVCSSLLDQLPGHEAARRTADATRAVLATARSSSPESR